MSAQPESYDVAAELSRLVDQLKLERDRGMPEALTLAEQRAYRAGFTRALALTASVAFRFLVEG